MTFDVKGMTCAACSAHVEKSVRKLEGVSEVTVRLLTNSMEVRFDPAAVTPGRVTSWDMQMISRRIFLHSHNL